MSAPSLETRLQGLLSRINALESKVKSVEESEDITVARVKISLSQNRVFTASLRKVSADYYDWPLEERARRLDCNPEHLCKTIIFRNTMCEHNNCSDIFDTKYVCVVVQYCAKIAGDRLKEFVHKLPPPEQRLSKNKINFQLADESISLQLSGFIHNAVTPLGMHTSMPVIVSEACAQLNPSFVWLGGGAVDVKLCITVADLIKTTNALVANISDPRQSTDTSNVDL
jgi:prolyl-tRNA editing enzyme YbaK/EbsC (Cys-tRNA(Pro) deacylase)